MPHRLIFALARVQQRLTAHLKKRIEEEGIKLSPGQTGIMLVLENRGQTTMGDLSQTLEIDNAAITRLVDKLEKQHLVERTINPDDRRQILITITEKGRSQAEIVKQIAKATNQQMVQGFSAEEVSIYQRINQAIIQRFSE